MVDSKHERGLFEYWYWEYVTMCKGDKLELFDTDLEGRYVNTTVEDYWTGFQSGRNAWMPVDVELPPRCTYVDVTVRDKDKSLMLQSQPIGRTVLVTTTLAVCLTGQIQKIMC